MSESTGAKLKSLRLQKGLSLEDVHKKTKIHLNILKAIEEDSLVNFSPIYIRGFQKIYCKFLGIDPKECIVDYKEPSSSVRTVEKEKEKTAPAWQFKLPKVRVKPKALILVILAFFFIIFLFKLGKAVSSKPVKPKQAVKRAPAAVVSKPSGKQQVQSTAKEQASAPAAKTITLDIHTKEDTFTQVKADGKVVFQNVLRKGRSESWQAKEKIELSVGSAGAVELEVNGKRISGLGRRGQALKNILITKEGMSIK